MGYLLALLFWLYIVTVSVCVEAVDIIKCEVCSLFYVFVTFSNIDMNMKCMSAIACKWHLHKRYVIPLGNLHLICEVREISVMKRSYTTGRNISSGNLHQFSFSLCLSLVFLQNAQRCQPFVPGVSFPSFFLGKGNHITNNNQVHWCLLHIKVIPTIVGNILWKFALTRNVMKSVMKRLYPRSISYLATLLLPPSQRVYVFCGVGLSFCSSVC